MRRIFLLAILPVLSLTAAAQTQNFDTVRIRPIKITENLYMLKGAGGNIGVLIGKDGTLMVDDQFAPLSNKINGAVKTLDPGEIRFLVNTHLHGDHSGGNLNFARMGATIVAHDNVRERLSKDGFIKALNRAVPASDKEALPVITFASKLNLHLNDEDIELIHLDPAHTDGDVAVHFKKANVYHTGDMFVRYGFPFVDESSGGSVTGLIRSLDQLLGMMDDKTRIIPGHGDLCGKVEMKAFRDRLVEIRDLVAAALKKGTKVEDIPALGITAKYDEEWGKGFFKGKDFVLLLATELKPAAKK